LGSNLLWNWGLAAHLPPSEPYEQHRSDSSRPTGNAPTLLPAVGKSRAIGTTRDHPLGAEMTSEQKSGVDGRDEPAGAAASRPQGSDTLAKSYRNLRLAMVGLLLCVAVAVLIQSWLQEWNLLGSVSAYYYTPAQAIFVGGLIGLGACMIALQGDTTVQDVFLNLGGWFAAIVAIVPTSRGADYRALVGTCREAGTPLLTEMARTGGLDCPTVQALEEATKANVDNNLWTLLAVGLIALLASVYTAWRAGTFNAQADRKAKRDFWWGSAAMVVLGLAVLIARLASLQWIIDNAHWIAAALLFVCIFVVGTVNAWRFKREQSGDVSRVGQSPVAAVGETVGDLIAVGRRPNRYIVIAQLMLLVGAVFVLLWWRHIITLFWLEGAVFVLFMVFWTVQTFELER
jgi:hypothetical protein